MTSVINNVLQQALPREQYSIIIRQQDESNWAQDIVDGPHHTFIVKSGSDLNQNMNYNFIVSKSILNNVDTTQRMARGLNVPLCIYEDEVKPELNKIVCKQLKTALSPIVVVFKDIETQESWKDIVVGEVLSDWNETLDLMKEKVFVI